MEKHLQLFKAAVQLPRERRQFKLITKPILCCFALNYTAHTSQN